MSYLMTDYDDALARILREGVPKPDRTGVGCLTVPGIQCRYRIDDRFPLVSRRRVWPKAVFAELVWFLSGSTNTFELNRLGAKFWDPWRSEAFEREHAYVPGSLGPLYGFQLRHYGGAYGDGSPEFWAPDPECPGEKRKRTRYGEGGFDQLAQIMHLLETDPHSRRIMFSLWQVTQLDAMRLPPCHYSYQVVVDGRMRVTGILTQRSADFAVGVPANIQMYSALTVMLAQQAGLEAFEFVHTTNDSHIYLDQVDAVGRYLETPVVDSPRLDLRKAPDIYSYTPEDFAVVGYHPGPRIDVPVAV